MSISPRICISSNDGMKLKISSVSPLMTIDDFMSDDINHLCVKHRYRSQFSPYSQYVSFLHKFCMQVLYIISGSNKNALMYMFYFQQVSVFSLCQRFIGFLLGVLELIPPWRWENAIPRII